MPGAVGFDSSFGGYVSNMGFRVASSRSGYYGGCECGWQGNRRWFRGSAVVDAGVHAAQQGHFPSRHDDFDLVGLSHVDISTTA